MVEVGQISIKGNLDTSNIMRGQRQISTGFGTMKQQTQSTFGSMELLSNSTKALGSALVTVGAVATTGLLGLAGITPILAPEFAKIKVETFKLANIFGKEFKPAIESATDAYANFVNFLGSGSGLGDFSTDLLTLVGGAGALTLFSSKLLGIKNMGRIFIPIAVAIGIAESEGAITSFGKKTGESIAGFLGAPEGGFTEGAMGKAGSIFATTGAYGVAGAAVGAGIGSFFGGVGALPGAAIGGVAGSVVGLGRGIYIEIKDEFFSDVDTVGGGSK